MKPLFSVTSLKFLFERTSWKCELVEICKLFLTLHLHMSEFLRNTLCFPSNWLNCSRRYCWKQLHHGNYPQDESCKQSRMTLHQHCKQIHSLVSGVCSTSSKQNWFLLNEQSSIFLRAHIKSYHTSELKRPEPQAQERFTPNIMPRRRFEPSTYWLQNRLSKSFAKTIIAKPKLEATTCCLTED